MKWLRFGYWNIYGVYKDGNPKTEDCDVHKIISSHDIFCLSEIHCAEENMPDIEGYGCFKVCRQKSERNNRYFGGIAVYYKKQLRQGIKFIKSETDFIWMKLSSSFFKSKKDIYVCMVYVPPEYDTYYRNRGIDSVGLIESDVSNIGKDGMTLLMGDFNARTGEVLDYIQYDSYDGIDDYNWYEPDVMDLNRTSRDIVSPCPRVNRSLELCKSAKLRLLNGRMLGDSFGSYTCYKEQGCSVVDYVLTNEDHIKDIAYFQVGDFNGAVSDHCYISTAVRVKCEGFDNEMLRHKRPSPVKYVWDERYIFKFQFAFNQHDISDMIGELMNDQEQLSNNCIGRMVSNLSNIYTKVADRTLKKRHVRKSVKRDKKWFDNSLQSLRMYCIYLIC